MKVLSIDFDYWFNAIGAESWVEACLPHPSSEMDIHCGFCKDEDSEWFSRGFRPSTLDCDPKVSTERVLKSIGGRVPVYVAESHASIVEVIDRHLTLFGTTYDDVEVNNIDHHSDDVNWLSDDDINCGSWAYVLQERGITYRWINDSIKDLEWFLSMRPDVVFVCKSTCCLHRSGDKQWLKFLVDLDSIAEDRRLMFMGHRSYELRKRYWHYLWRRGVSAKNSSIIGIHPGEAVILEG